MAYTSIITLGSAYPDPTVTLVLTPSHPPENLPGGVVVYSYDEPVILNITLRNEGPGPVTVLGVPPRIGINHIEGPNLRTWQRNTSVQVLHERESITTVLVWDQHDDEGTQVEAGIYTIGVYYLYAPGDNGGVWDMSGVRQRTGAVNVLIASPNGSLQKNMVMHMAVPDDGVTATLVSLDCNTMKGTASFDVEIPEKRYDVTPRPEGMVPCDVNVYPVAVYRIDGGDTRKFVDMDFICDTTQSQIHKVHLYSEPLSAEAKTMDIHVSKFGNHAGSWDYVINFTAQYQDQIKDRETSAKTSFTDEIISFLKKLFGF
jgi:hypothetical protein